MAHDDAARSCCGQRKTTGAERQRWGRHRLCPDWAHGGRDRLRRRKLRSLEAIGADYGINYAREDFSRVVWQMSGKTGMDVIVNFTGGDTWVPSIKALRVGGRMLTCGASAGFDPRTDIRYIWRREISIVGCNSWGREDLEDLLELSLSGKIVPPIHGVYPLAETREAFRALKDREVFGNVIVAP